MTFQGRYKYNPSTDLLGKGGFARVYKATDTLLDREVAIKVFNSTDGGQYTVIEEIKKAIRLQHPNLLRYYDVAVVENTNALGEADTLQIGVMELANAGDLKQFARKNPNSPLLFSLLQQVLSGLEYLHQKGIIHRDLKPQNILLIEEDGEYTAKISDFGISKRMDSGTNSASMAIGTIEYMAPEQFSPGKYGINGKIGTNVDLWSFGIMVHELLTDQPLFGQRNGNTTAEQIMNAILSQTLPPDIETLPEPYKTVVKRCLVSDANQRIQKAKELIGLLHESNYPAEESAETMQYVRPVVEKAGREPVNETAVMPKAEVKLPEHTVSRSPEINSPVKTSRSIYYILALFLIVAGTLSWWFGQNNASAKAVEQYQFAMKNQTDTATFLSQMEKLAESGSDSATWQLANHYTTNGEISKAVPFIKNLIDSTGGNITSKYPGIISMYAQVLTKNNKIKDAVDLLQRCADAECAYQLGMLYYNGKGVTRDYAKAKQSFEQSAVLGNDKAETMLGNIYVMGQGVNPNNSLAIKYYFKAADKGNVVAMYALGLLYANGTGVEKNTEEAKKWFQQVLDKGTDATVVSAARHQMNVL